MNTLYLWINILSLAFPLALSFDKKVAFYKEWGRLFPAIFLTAILFIVWDHFFTLWGVWGFNKKYIVGYYLGTLPLEEVLFFVTVPYACTFVYSCLKAYFPNSFQSPIWYRYVPLLFLGLGLVLYIFHMGAIYTSVTIIFLFLLLGFSLFRSSGFLRFFVPAFLISIVPMLIVNGILTSRPVVYYEPGVFSGIRLGSIPVEDFFYNACMLLCCIGLYEGFRRKQSPSESPSE
jgi:lycopene cyclase domain-containing protein